MKITKIIKAFAIIAVMALAGYNVTLKVETAQAKTGLEWWYEAQGLNSEGGWNDGGDVYDGGYLDEVCINGSGYGTGMAISCYDSMRGPQFYCEATGNCDDSCTQWSIDWRTILFGTVS